MIFVWLLVWLCANTPSVRPWNGWFVALIVCALIQLSSR